MKRSVRNVFFAALLATAAPSRATQPPNVVDSDNAGNTAAGTNALNTLDTGDSNSAFGQNALGGDTTGNANTAVGDLVLQSNTGGDDNTGVGSEALNANTTGFFNSALGAQALAHNTTGKRNTAAGVDAMSSNETGSDNVAIGPFALSSNETGSKNIAIGEQALTGSTGSGNIAIGKNAGIQLTTGDGNLYLDSKGSDGESGTIRIGRAAHVRTFVAGIAGVPVTGVPVLVGSDGRLGIQASSARYKRDIRAMGDRSRSLLNLRPVTFRYKADPNGERQYGLIAEEVGRLYPELVSRGPAGQVEAVRYQELAPMLLNELQRQQRELAALQADNAAMRAALAELRERVDGRATATSAAWVEPAR